MKYLLVYYGGGMPETPAAQARVLKQWEKWFAKLGPAMVDGGNPFSGAVNKIRADGSVAQGRDRQARDAVTASSRPPRSTRRRRWRRAVRSSRAAARSRSTKPSTRCNALPSFFVERDGERAVIVGDDARHLARSLRARVGEEIEVIDPEGFMLTLRLDRVSPERVEGTVVAERAHSPEPLGANRDRDRPPACACARAGPFAMHRGGRLRLSHRPGRPQRGARFQARALAHHLPRGGDARRPAGASRRSLGRHRSKTF